MRISKRDANLLLLLLGIVIFLFGYFGVFSPTQTKTDVIRAEVKGLAPTLQELQGYQDNLSAYQAGIDKASATIGEEMLRYPTDVRSEDLVMYAIYLEKDLDIDVTSVEFSETVPIAQINSVVKTDGGYTLSPLTAYECSMTAACSLSYAELKALLLYPGKTPARTTLGNLSISFDAESGQLTGSVVFDKYFVTSGSDPYVPTEVPKVELGTRDPFGTFTVKQTEPAA
jgi:hypothetical protein